MFQAVGDENTDIFDGLAIAHHGGPALVHHWLDKPLYVSQEQVAAIQEGRVRLTVTAAEAQHLPEHTVAETVEILPEKASLWERFKGDLEKHRRTTKSRLPERRRRSRSTA